VPQSIFGISFCCLSAKYTTLHLLSFRLAGLAREFRDFLLFFAIGFEVLVFVTTDFMAIDLDRIRVGYPVWTIGIFGTWYVSLSSTSLLS
jgi:hypothetical protein